MLSVSGNVESVPRLAWTKHIDHTPDITSDEYWDTHHIAVVRVTGIDKDVAGKDRVAHRVELKISEGPMEQTRMHPLSHLWFGLHIEEWPPVAINDTLVIYYAKEGPSAIVTAKLDTSPEESPLVNRLLRIASLRRNEGGLKALSEGVFDPDPPVALYCLKRLLKDSALEMPADYIARLQELRGEEGRQAQVRLLASKLANRLQGREANSEEEYSWLRTAIAQSGQSDWTQLKPFVDRLLEFENKRSENIAFLAQLVRDAKKREAIRIAAYSAFEDPRLFRFSAPDTDSDKIFNACVEMLRDRKPLIRRAGAALLHNICVRPEPELKRRYMERAKTSIKAAGAVEKNGEVRYQLNNYLELISRAPS